MCEKHGEKLEVLCFPSNQFGFQEWLDGQEIVDCMTHVRPGKGFEPKFTMMEKTCVNGKDGHEVFKALKGALPFRNTSVAWEAENPFGTQSEGYFKSVNYTPFSIADVIWNFEHFLVKPDGTPHGRYHALQSYEDIRKDLESILV